MKNNRNLINEVLTDIAHDMSDEEVLKLLAESKVSENPEKQQKKDNSFGAKAADAIAKFAGSWAFILSFVVVLTVWMILNVLLAAKAFDPYPFILLNLVLSCVAAIQAPLIMMSQNRQEEKDRKRAENDSSYLFCGQDNFYILSLLPKLHLSHKVRKFEISVSPPLETGII